jgi:bifunctional UDP-N-acetylglucosamine pyrophosphorylase/glucosamine-1-phosphate N-acetyltransferase
MIDHVVTTIEQSGIDTVVVIVGVGRDAVVAELERGHPGVLVTVQEEQLGTGHAARVALEAVPGDCRQVWIFSGDTPLLSVETVAAIAREHRERTASLTLLSAELEDPTGYGRLIRDGEGLLARIVEEKDASEEERQVQEINAGTYLFEREALFRSLGRISSDNAQGEYYLTDTISILREEGERVAAHTITDAAEEALGVNTMEQLLAAENIMMAREVAE